jgi:serine/threonine protein kinase
LSGLSPFGGETDEDTLRNVRNCDWNIEDPSFSAVSANSKDFIKRLLVREPDRRLTVHQALDHPWLAEQLRRREADEEGEEEEEASPTKEIPSDRLVFR